MGLGCLAVAASRCTIGYFFFGGDTSSYVLVLVLVRESCAMMNYFLRARGRCRARAPLRAKPVVPECFPLYAPTTSSQERLALLNIVHVQWAYQLV
jgi:hypothetical protein